MAVFDVGTKSSLRQLKGHKAAARVSGPRVRHPFFHLACRGSVHNNANDWASILPLRLYVGEEMDLLYFLGQMIRQWYVLPSRHDPCPGPFS